MVTLAHMANFVAYFFHDPGAFMAQNRRYRNMGPVAFDHVPIRMTDPTGD